MIGVDYRNFELSTSSFLLARSCLRAQRAFLFPLTSAASSCSCDPLLAAKQAESPAGFDGVQGAWEFEEEAFVEIGGCLEVA